MADLLSEAFSARLPVDVSLCHGDLVPSNLCRTQDKIYFLDWDRSGRAPVLRDILRLALRSPDSSAALLMAMRDALSPILKGNPAVVFTATIARKMVRMPDHRRALLAFWKQHYSLWRNGL